MADIFLTPIELAKRWKMSTNTLTNWRAQKVGPPITKIGLGSKGKVLYRLADVESYESDRRPRVSE